MDTDATIAALLALIPSEHRMAVLGWLYVLSGAVVVFRWIVLRYAPKAARSPWLHALDLLLHIASLSSQRLSVTAKPRDGLIEDIADRATNAVNRRDL